MLRPATHLLILTIVSVGSVGQNQQTQAEPLPGQVSSPAQSHTIEWAIVLAASIPALVAAFALISVRKAVQGLTLAQFAERCSRPAHPRKPLTGRGPWPHCFGRRYR